MHSRNMKMTFLLALLNPFSFLAVFHSSKAFKTLKHPMSHHFVSSLFFIRELKISSGFASFNLPTIRGIRSYRVIEMDHAIERKDLNLEEKKPKQTTSLPFIYIQLLIAETLVK